MFVLDSVLKKIMVRGTLAVVDHRGRRWKYAGARAGPGATMHLHTARLPLRIALRPDLALGEAYMDGTLTVEDGGIYELLAVLMDNAEASGDYALRRFGRAVARGFRRVQQYNPASRAQRNVAHHYDLSGDLYRLFLDPDLQYSCAYFRVPDEPLEEAQRNKRVHIAAKLVLDRPGLRVLDIGSGWGGLALDLAKAGEARVTGVTLSAEQHRASTARAAEAGLGTAVRFGLQDYRAVEGQFDRIVSVGMFEHVGVNHFDTFFGTCRRLLAEDGIGLVHTIGRASGPDHTSAWIRKYIFPGGYSPALSEIVPAIESAGLWITDVEVLRTHYAETLKAWRRRFAANRSAAVALYDERFARMWEFYLAASECAFRFSDHVVFQIQFSRRKGAVPEVRDYIASWERRASQRDAAE